MRIQKSKSEKIVQDLVSKAKLAHKVGGHLFRIEGNVLKSRIGLFWTNSKKKAQVRGIDVEAAEFKPSFDHLTEVVHSLNEAPAKKKK